MTSLIDVRNSWLGRVATCLALVAKEHGATLEEVHEAIHEAPWVGEELSMAEVHESLHLADMLVLAYAASDEEECV